MSELLGLLIRGVVVLVGHLASALDPVELWERRRRRGRLASLARAERVEIPCLLRDPLLTDGRQRQGRLAVGDPPVTWRADGRTGLRLHPDEAPSVLRAIAGPSAG